VHLHAGIAYLRLRAFEPAIQANAKALELAPDSITALNGLGYSYAEAGRQLDKAIAYVTRAIELARKEGVKPRMMGALVDSLGWAYYQDGRYDDALKTLAEAASLAPDFAEIQYHLGLAYEKKGRYIDARVALARAVTSEPEMSLYRRDLERVTEKLKARGEFVAPPAAKDSAAPSSVTPQ
jgi:tetratricopeptide (TPR) repeat protein